MTNFSENKETSEINYGDRCLSLALNLLKVMPIMIQVSRDTPPEKLSVVFEGNETIQDTFKGSCSTIINTMAIPIQEDQEDAINLLTFLVTTNMILRMAPNLVQKDGLHDTVVDLASIYRVLNEPYSYPFKDSNVIKILQSESTGGNAWPSLKPGRLT